MSIEYRFVFLPLAIVAAMVAVGAIQGCSPEGDEAPEAPEPKELAPSEPVEVTPSVAATEGAKMEHGQLAVAYSETPPEVRLGARLFNDVRLTNPGAPNLSASCRTCHVPPEASSRKRQYADSTALSVIPTNAMGSKQETFRNTTTLLDAITETSFNADGEFATIEALILHELTSTHMGWLPGEEELAKDAIFGLMFYDYGEDLLAEGNFLEQFKAAKGIELETMQRDAVVAEIVASLVDYLKVIQTHNTSAYDAMAHLNRFEEGLAGEEDTPQQLSERIFGRIANQEGRTLIRLPSLYSEEAYQGFKTFYRVSPTWSSSVEGMEENAGNCIACHVPPKFADGKFHNIGVTQAEYDGVHGDGTFVGLDAASPSEATRARIKADDASKVDLGRWNVDPSDGSFAAFKTPKLRFITHTGPYMHNGAHEMLEDAIRQHIWASELAKAGTLRNADPELLTMNISEHDIPQLVAFLETLQEVPEEEYRRLRTEDVRIRQDPMGEKP